MAYLHQNILIYRDGDDTVALGEIDRAEVRRGRDAAEVIQWSVDQAASHQGGAVRLSPGQYMVERTVHLADHVTLSGAGQSTRIIVTDRGQTGVRLHRVKGARVQDLALTAADYSPAAMGIDVSTSGDCQLSGLYAEGFDACGIRLGDNSFLCRVSGCSLAGNRTCHLLCETLNRGPHGDWITNLIDRCTIYGGGTGVRVIRSLVLNLSDLQIYQTGGPAFHITDRSNAVSIRGCRTYQITGDALVAIESHELHIVANVFSWHTEAGLSLRDCCWGTVCGNNIIDTGSLNPGGECMKTTYGDLPKPAPSYPGVSMKNCHGFTVSGNALFNWPACPPMTDGVELDASCKHNVVTGNNANYFRDEAVDAPGPHATVQANAGYGPTPLWRDGTHDGSEALFHDDGHAIQSFRPELTEAFIRSGIAPPDNPNTEPSACDS